MATRSLRYASDDFKGGPLRRVVLRQNPDRRRAPCCSRIMRALTLALLLAALAPATATADSGWTVQPGAGLEGGDALYCGAPCDVYGVRNVHSAYRLDVGVGNSNPQAGPIVAGTIAFCWDITCSSWAIYGGHHNPLVEVTPTHTDFRAPNGRLLVRLSNRGIVLYARPRIR